MKRRAVILLLLLAAPAWAATPWSLDVSWTAPTTNDCSGFVPSPQWPTCPVPLTDLAGYRLYFSAPCPSQQYAVVPTPTSQPAPGDTVSVTVNGLTPAKTYTAQITAVDLVGNESACSALASGSTLAAAPPLALGSLALAFRPSTAAGAVAFDAKPTAYNSADGLSQQASNVTTISATSGFTVGAGASCLVATIVFQDGSFSSAGPTSVTMTWNGVSMTAGPTVTTGAGTRIITAAIFVLVNPASGAKTLSASWTNAQDVYMSAVSFTGSDTSTCINGADSTTVTAVLTDPVSIVITATSDGATVATMVADGATPTTSQTKIWAEAPLSPGGGGSYAIGGSGTTTHTFTGAGGTVQALAGVHVIAASGGAARAVFRPAEQLTGTGIGGSFFRTVPD